MVGKKVWMTGDEMGPLKVELWAMMMVGFLVVGVAAMLADQKGG